jgi:hypothetical protein
MSNPAFCIILFLLVSQNVSAQNIDMQLNFSLMERRNAAAYEEYYNVDKKDLSCIQMISERYADSRFLMYRFNFIGKSDTATAGYGVAGLKIISLGKKGDTVSVVNKGRFLFMRESYIFDQDIEKIYKQLISIDIIGAKKFEFSLKFRE